MAQSDRDAPASAHSQERGVLDMVAPKYIYFKQDKRDEAEPCFVDQDGTVDMKSFKLDHASIRLNGVRGYVHADTGYTKCTAAMLVQDLGAGRDAEHAIVLTGEPVPDCRDAVAMMHSSLYKEP